MDDRRVLVSAKGARYHVDGDCAGRRQGVSNSENLGRNLHAPQWLNESEAVAAGKLPCKRCADGV